MKIQIITEREFPDDHFDEWASGTAYSILNAGGQFDGMVDYKQKLNHLMRKFKELKKTGEIVFRDVHEIEGRVRTIYKIVKG